MSRINILEPAVFNKIAAGEVVEKPASVIKELVENSIDAGATFITIEILDGGIKQIKVVDNGTGIQEDDFLKVFLPHATSKVKNVEDLSAISSLGFRGEALASISSVSNVELISKYEGAPKGYKMNVNGGNIGEKLECASSKGTSICVSDLFFNIPARAKFLKKPKQEQSEITNLVSRFILANPNIKFKYIADNKVVFETFRNGLNEAIYVVYGKETAENILPLTYLSQDGIKVHGYIGKPLFAKKNKTYQTLVINGRYVINNIVSSAVSSCYEHYLMKGQFPFYVINLDIPLDKLDVNVHPNKLDVRFENSNHIFGVILNAVSKTLAQNNNIAQVNANINTYKEVSGGISFNESNTGKVELNIQETHGAKKVEEGDFVLTTSFKNINEGNKQEFLLEGEQSNENDLLINETKRIMDEVNIVRPADNFYKKIEFSNSVNDSKDLFRVPGLLQKLEEEVEGAHEEIKHSTKPYQETLKIESSVKFVGEIYNTYLIVEVDGSCFIIDQHAAHERLLFDKLVKEVNEKAVGKQLLLFPHELNVNISEFDYLESNLNKIQELGFDIEVFGKNCFRISSIPAILTGMNLDNFFTDILSDLTVFKNYNQSDLVLEKLMQKSCKAAVKAGKTMLEGEVKALLSLMKEEKMVLSCPHGRPVMVELTQKELEKWFKRIV